MGEWVLSFFGDSIALLTFFSIFAAGMTFTVFNLMFGGDADHDGDGGDAHGPGLLSIQGVSFLLTGFGGVAFIVMHFTGKVFVSSLAGLAGGWPFALVCLALYRVFIRQEASSLISAKDFDGASGAVVTSIPKKGLGEVTILVAGQQITKSAVTSGGTALATGTPIRVKQYLGDRVIVEPIEK